MDVSNRDSTRESNSNGNSSEFFAANSLSNDKRQAAATMVKGTPSPAKSQRLMARPQNERTSSLRIQTIATDPESSRDTRSNSGLRQSKPSLVESSQNLAIPENTREDDEGSLMDELEDELEMEEALAKLTAKLNKFHGQDKKMKIGKKTFEINDKDPIFFLNGPMRKQIRTGSCVSCQDFVFESSSQMHFCQFCGHSNCDKCLYKDRMFPRGRINAEGQKPRGDICKLCDRKFLVRQMTLETALASQKARQNVRNLENQTEDFKKENVLLVNSRDQDRFRNQKAERDLDTDIEDTRLEITVLQNKHQEKSAQSSEQASKIKQLKDKQLDSDEEDPQLALDTLTNSKHMLDIKAQNVPRQSGGAGCGGEDACCTIF